MIKLACNYCLEAKQLVKENKIALDYFKYPGLGYHMNIFENSDLSDYEKFITELINRLRRKQEFKLLMKIIGALKHQSSYVFIYD